MSSAYMYDIAQIRPNSIIIYPYYEFTGTGKKSSKYLFWKPDTTNSNKTKGTLSRNSIIKLKYAINLLTVVAQNKTITITEKGYQVRSYVKELGQYIEKDNLPGSKEFKYKLGFLTLTLPALQGTITDDYIKRSVLNHFLTDCRRYLGLRNYVWKAEAQENGNIHFHITTDCFLPHDVTRKFWNTALKKTGLIQQYRTNMKEYHKNGFTCREDLLKYWDLEKQEKAYEYGIKTNWSNPNTIDIHSVRKIRNMASYLVDYMCKKEENKRPIVGKIWGCSKNLNYINKLSLPCLDDNERDIRSIYQALEHKVIKTDYVTIIPYNEKEFDQHFSSNLKKRWAEFITDLRFNE